MFGDESRSSYKSKLLNAKASLNFFEKREDYLIFSFNFKVKKLFIALFGGTPRQ
jgi:hypothetical protein